jgi:hypothetical protein
VHLKRALHVLKAGRLLKELDINLNETFISKWVHRIRQSRFQIKLN